MAAWQSSSGYRSADWSAGACEPVPSGEETWWGAAHLLRFVGGYGVTPRPYCPEWSMVKRRCWTVKGRGWMKVRRGGWKRDGGTWKRALVRVALQVSATVWCLLLQHSRPSGDGPFSFLTYSFLWVFSARCVRRTSRRAIAVMFVRLSVRLSGRGVYCHHAVHFCPDFSLRFDSPMFWAPWHQSISTYSQSSFSNSTWKRGGIWMCKLGEASFARNYWQITK